MIHLEHFILQTLLYVTTPLVKVLCQLSSLTISYPNIVLHSYFLTFLVPMYASWRPPLRHTALCRFYSSEFLTKWILLLICMVCFVSLPFLAIHTYDLIFNTKRSFFHGTTSRHLFRKSLFIILKCYISITTVHAALYSLSELYWETGTGTCVKWSIVPPW